MRKLILHNHQSPGDVLMLTAAVRDLHLAYPGRFLTDVRTSCPELWVNNPYITDIDDEDDEARTIHCGYPMIHQSHFRPFHFIQGFVADLNDQLNLNVQISDFRGDIHLSDEELESGSSVGRWVGRDGLPYWIVVAGGKFDFTAKWWQHSRYQSVVDHFYQRLLFVQTGERGHFHPPLVNVLDLRGKTPLRELILLVHHSEGVVCPVTFLMHLAAAVPMTQGRKGWRPCVVVAGGRESPHWEAYPGHQFLHTVGALPCCLEGGCWKSRVVPLNDGDEKDHPENLCSDVVEGQPQCMRMIRAEHVVERIETYLEGGLVRLPGQEDWSSALPFLSKDLKTRLGLHAVGDWNEESPSTQVDRRA